VNVLEVSVPQERFKPMTLDRDKTERLYKDGHLRTAYLMIIICIIWNKILAVQL